MVRLFRVFVPTTILGLLLSETLLVTACYLAAASALVESDLPIFLLYENGGPRLALVVVSILLGVYFNDLYAELRVLSRVLLIQQMSLVIGIAFLTQGLVAYVNPDWRLPRRVMLAGSTLCFVLLPLWRILYSAVAPRILGGERVLLLGTGPLMRRLAAHLREHPELNYICLGFLTAEEEGGDGIPPEDLLGGAHDLCLVAERLRPTRIIVGPSERRQNLPIEDLLRLRRQGIRAEEAASLYEVTFGRVPLELLRPSQLVFSDSFGPEPRALALQTAYSKAIAALLLLLAAPVMAVVAVLVKLCSPGPALFRQVRVGLNGKPFTLMKFRSMREDAEAATGAVWAQENDPRITGLGRFLRRVRLDELPQLFNVLKGEMALVGPRPERPEFVGKLEKEIPYYGQRHSVKPGITGWAQINYKYGNTIEDTIIKLEYDLYYIKHFSPALDFYIMFHTAKTMLLTRGAA